MLKSFVEGAIFGERFGDGPLRVLALHGWGRDRRDYNEVLTGLDAAAIDLPGFGASPEPSDPMGAAGYARLIAPVLDEFEMVRPFWLATHSEVGYPSTWLRCGRTGSEPWSWWECLCSGAPWATGALRPFPIGSSGLFERIGLVGDERMERARQRYGSADYRAARGVMREVLVTAVHETYEAQLEEIVQPVHLVWGADDPDVPVEIANRAMHHLKNGRTDGARRGRSPRVPRSPRGRAGGHPGRNEVMGTVWAGATVSYGLAAVRWLRVAQREHYLSWTVTRFAWRWWDSRATNRTLVVTGLVALGFTFVYPEVGLLTALIVAIGPLGLTVAGRTAPLRWTAVCDDWRPRWRL